VTDLTCQKSATEIRQNVAKLRQILQARISRSNKTGKRVRQYVSFRQNMRKLIFRSTFILVFGHNKSIM